MSNPKPFPVKWKFDAYQGDAFLRQFRFFYRDATGTSQILDTTGWTGRMAVGRRVREEDGTITTEILLHSDDAEITVTTGIQGTGDDQYCLEVYISDANTALLPAGLIGVYDIELTDTSGDTTTVLYGLFCVEGEVTT